MAQPLSWMPDSLYNYSITSVVSYYATYEKDIRTFHGPIIFDVYYKLYKDGLLLLLAKEFENLNLFEKVLKVSDKRYLLHTCFQALMDHGHQTALKLAEAYRRKCLNIFDTSFPEKDKVIHLGFSLGRFLTDAGWFPESEIVLTSCLILCQMNDAPYALALILECYKRLLRVRNIYCKFEEAEQTFKDAQSCILQIKKLQLDVNLAGIYSEFASFYFIQSNYKEAYRWGDKAINELNSSLPSRDLVNILRIASKSCVVKKQFKQAEFLIKQAVQRAREKFGDHSLIYADTLIDFGYFFLYADAIGHAVEVYQKALDIHIEVLGGKNLLIAIAHEDLAYASYVYEYSSGRFKDARYHIIKALTIKESLISEDHFLLQSAKRVHALIVEEIAIDSHDKEFQERFFSEAEDLHTSALKITQQCLGELNVQTGKHYGNLGRLYQSMRKFNEARRMHLKAISIKQEILGPDDYEVAISMGHLASLYSYDLGLYEEAITLYEKTIEIGLKQFGKGYSGLEYDYRGLLSVYSTLGDADNVMKLHSDLQDWKLLRDQTLDKASKTSPLKIDLELVSPDKIYECFALLQ
ncbi:amyloid protein-binding protein 2 [Nephila pilipes]|uniref:Amyloid protein-binding protein 2 n=1 Tax=Nephila pilipes TaxID=299642 RepID=A0A8X6NQK8_NEPPI|nr:amyloid protein-binding protein 2 [Nephila pilipes]GFT28366.1 amyloid protein-binding protein 2 [Nephila pilipes]